MVSSRYPEPDSQAVKIWQLRQRIQNASALQVKDRLLAEFSPKLHFLFEPAPYKVGYSGRYAGKSWSWCLALLQIGIERPIRVLCARETMKSLKDSVHKLLCDQIERLGLQKYYTITTTGIRGTNGTEFFYAGLKNNITNIKSIEGCDFVWVEEAQNVSKRSWETLIPTIRKPGAEIWVTFNPEFAKDDTYVRWVVNPPPGAVVVQLSWRDNQYLTQEMQNKMDHLRNTDLDEYNHVYEGATLSTVADAVYKMEIFRAEKNNQFTRIAYDPRKAVETYWDLGFGDMVSIWFVQPFPFETRIIDYYENTHQALDHYLKVLQAKEYTYGECVFPWDGGAAHVNIGKSSADIARAKGYRVKVLNTKQGAVHERINYLRMMFPQLYFDAQKCEIGIERLRHYQWGPPSANGVLKREPLHDSASHASDALAYMAWSIKTPSATIPGPKVAPRLRSAGGSMAGFR